ncbi:MAG: methyltransferase domain-containing protein [Planctomycetales bacterium]|nr:methyltransferase domain-containing protein [Planctomycetales bacterium]
MWRRLADYRLFWQEFRRTFYSTGAVMPSGRRLARTLAKYVGRGSDAAEPRRILEVGPGTGTVTEAIIEKMGANDTLDLVELNDRFVTALQQRIDNDPVWRSAAPRIRLHHQAIEEHRVERPYDVMVSGLPFNNFPGAAVRSILSHLESMAADGATLSFFEYVAVRPVKSLACRVAERRRLTEVGQAVDSQRRRWGVGRDCVVGNVPPAWVHHLQFRHDDRPDATSSSEQKATYRS